MTDPVPFEALVSGMARRGAPLPSETALFVVLQAVEALASRPSSVTAGDLLVTPEGGVTPGPGASPCGDPDAVGAVASLLSSVLAPPPAPVRELLDRVARGEVATLGALAPELEALLVPLNRSAARRVLGRLVREHARAASVPEPTEGEDRDEGEGEGELGEGVLSAAGARDEGEGEGAHETEGDALDTVVDGPPPAASEAEALGTDPDGRATDTAPDGETGDWDDPPVTARRGRRSSGGAVAFAVFAGALFLAAGAFLVRQLRGSPSEPEVSPPSHALRVSHEGADAAVAPRAPRPARAVRSVLTVTSSPEGAEVFVYRGRAPVEVERVAQGVPQDFVATLEGRAASRAAVPADAVWEPGGQGVPRFELALQLPALPSGVVALTSLPPGEQGGSADAGTGATGTVRVVTTPPGARVYQRVGVTGPILVEGIGATEVTEVLAWKPGYRLERVTIPPSEWHPEGDRAVAAVRFTLTSLLR